MKSFRYLTALGALLGLCLAPTAEAVIISVKSLGMGGIGIGYAQDAMAAANNPASATNVDDRFDFGTSLIHLTGDATFSNSLLGPLVNGKYNGYHRMKNFIAPNFGVNKNIDCNWSVGLVSYNRDLTKTTYKETLFIIGTSKAGLEYLDQVIAPYISYNFGQLSLGVSFDWHIRRAKVNGFQKFDNPITSVSPGNVTNKGYNWSNGIAYTFGAYWNVTDTINVGATYQPEGQMSRFKKYKGFLAQGGKLNTPEKIGAGLSWRFMECATFAFDYEFVRWKQIKSISNPLINGIGGVNDLGASNGPAFGFKNKNYFRFGVDYAWSEEIILRAGYRYAKTQIPKSQTALNAFTLEPLVENIATVGATWVLSCRNEIDVYGAYGFEKKLHGNNVLPLALAGGDVTLKQKLWAIGISWGHKF